MTKRKRRKPLNPVNTGDRVPPTPETVAKLVPCPIAQLHAAGKLTDEDVKAAQEINDVFIAVTAAQFSRAADFDVGRSYGGIAPALARAHSERYLPWASTMAAWERRSGLAVMEFCINVIVELRPIPSGKWARVMAWALEEYHSPGALVRRVAWAKGRPISYGRAA